MSSTPAEITADVVARLDAYGHQVGVEIERALDLEMSDYLRDPALEYPRRPGKAIRPSLCMATCEALGGDPEPALGTATALELFHNSFLVHDDIEDESELRRGLPTLHRSVGLALALNAGAGLAAIASKVLRNTTRGMSPRLASRLAHEFEFMMLRTVDGQAVELGWRRDNVVDLDPGDYLDLIMRKTCWYTAILPLRAGALIGTDCAVDVDAMVHLGFQLGAAFQIRDDVLNVIGDQEVYGKERGGDLVEGKRTLLLIHLLAAASPGDREWVVAVLGMPTAQRRRHVPELIQLYETYGSVSFATEFAEGIAGQAAETLEDALRDAPESDAKSFLRAMVPYLVRRER